MHFTRCLRAHFPQTLIGLLVPASVVIGENSPLPFYTKQTLWYRLCVADSESCRPEGSLSRVTPLFALPHRWIVGSTRASCKLTR